MAGLGFWLLVSALLALLGGRARANAPGLPPAGSVAASAAAPAPVPGALPTSGQFQGQVVFSDVLIAPAAQFPSPAAMTDALKRLKRTTVEGAGGFWRLHMVAFLDPAPRNGAFQLRATDVTDPKDPREVRLFDVDGTPGDHELAVSDLVVTEVMGFTRGHRYEIAVIPRRDDQPAGKGDVYAKGVITLM
ncbi:MAG TPA: hypothetical protein VGP64_11075 [Polyangia bacterium]|jgi:hypothetical protein